MVRYLIIFYIMGIYCQITVAQARKIIDRSLITKIVVQVPELKCVQCKRIVENFLLRTEGVVELKTNLDKRNIEIRYIQNIANIDYIRTAIANAGYDLDTIQANPDSRKYLPICCLEKFIAKDFNVYIEKEKELYKKNKKTYRKPKKHICCYECDLVVKYRSLRK